MTAPLWFDHQAHRQADTLDAAEMVAGRLVRYRVHHDTSYWYQSSATAEVWSTGVQEWHPLASVLPGVWAGAADSNTSPEHIAAVRRNEAGLTAATEAVYAILQARAAAVLGVAS